MRSACLLLILANVLYLIWSQAIDVQVNALDRVPARTAERPPRIVLAREAQIIPEDAPVSNEEPSSDQPDSSSASASSAATVATNGVQGFSCTSIGPFADLAEASEAQAALRTAGFSAQQRVEQGELWVGYWVSVQDLATREAADEAMQSLQSSGISDVYLMPGTDPGYTLSLGVFSDHQRAQRRADEARALGLDTRIEDRKRAGSVYWLDVEPAEPGQTIDLAVLQSDPGKIMRLEMRSCPEGA
jgi:hypothetical protein